MLGTACTSKAPESAMPADPAQALILKGRTVYRSYCISCHNLDPRQPGVIGPDVFGSSRALIEARLLHNAYPPGYTPKRQSKGMPLFPQLQADIPALSAYLNSPSP